MRAPNAGDSIIYCNKTVSTPQPRPPAVIGAIEFHLRVQRKAQWPPTSGGGFVAAGAVGVLRQRTGLFFNAKNAKLAEDKP
jgi:hypothetical protein